MEQGKIVICQCSQKCINEAIEIFQSTDLPFPKAKKLVTGCNKNCCKKPLLRLFDMVYFGKVETQEIVDIIEEEKRRILDFL